MEQLIYSPKSLGSAIKRQRKIKKLSQNEAGRAFNLDQTTVSSIEQGAPGTRLETLFRMLAALELEMVIRPKKIEDIKRKKENW
ncbi:MAG: XRE family transcriptional regulator [uncultured bacterium]|nr:MAG: XRE family transcriptional regulator [uncultured bacterium]